MADTFLTPNVNIIGAHTGFDPITRENSYTFTNKNTGTTEKTTSTYGRDVMDRLLNVDLGPGGEDAAAAAELWGTLAPVFNNLRAKDQRGYYRRAIAPVLRSIPAYFAGGPWDIVGLLSYVPSPDELIMMGYEAVTDKTPSPLAKGREIDAAARKEIAEYYGTEATRRRYQQNLRAADDYAEDQWGFRPFEASIGTDMTPEARGIWEKMLTASVEFGVSGPVMVKGVTLPLKAGQGLVRGAQFIFSKLAKESANKLGEAALKPENVRSLIDQANDAYSVFKRQGRRNIAAEAGFGAVAGPMTEGALHLLEKADPEAAGWVKMLTAIGSGIGGPLAVRGAWTSLLQGMVIRVAAKHAFDPIFRPGHAASTFVQGHLGGTKADRVTIASTGRLLEEAIHDGRHVHAASGLAFTTPELARTEAHILRAEIQLKRERLYAETDDAVRKRLEQEIEIDELNVGHLNRTAKFYEDVLESAATDQTPGASARFFQDEAIRLEQRRDHFFNYIEGQFKRAYDELDFNGKPGGTPEELRIDYEKTGNPEYVPEFEANRRKLVMQGDPRGVESSELLWLEPQTRTRAAEIQKDLSAKMDEAVVRAQDAARGRVDFWGKRLQSYLANRGLKSVDDLSEAEKDLVGDLIRGTYDDAGREWRAFEKAAYRRIKGLDVKVTENIVFPKDSRDFSNGNDISGMTVEEYAASRFDNLSPEEAFNPGVLPPQLAQLAGARTVIALMNRRQKEAAQAGRARGAEEKISHLESRRDDAIAQRDDVGDRLTKQRNTDRTLSENNVRTLDAYYLNATENLDDAGKQAVSEFFNDPSMDWVGMSLATARGLAPKGLGGVFSEIAKQKKRIAELGEGVTSSPAVRALDKKMEGFAVAAQKAQNSIDAITSKFFGVGDDVKVPFEETGRLTARDATGALVRGGTSAEDVRTVASNLAEAARLEKFANGISPRYRIILQVRETIEQLLDSRTFPDLNAGQLNFARETSRIENALDEAQGTILAKGPDSGVKVPVERAAETVLPSEALPTVAASKLRLLREATADVPDFVTITRDAKGRRVAAINEEALDGATSLFARDDSPFYLVRIGEEGTPFEIRMKPNFSVSDKSLKVAEAILLERLAITFPDGVDSKGLESFRKNNNAAIKFLEDNGRPDVPDLVKDADGLAVQLDALGTLRQDKTRRLLTELVEKGELDLKSQNLTVDDYLEYIGQRRKRISEDRAFSVVLNADPGRAVRRLFDEILLESNQRPKLDMQEFMSLVRGNKLAEKGFQASVMGQLFARSLSKSDRLLKETGGLRFKAFDPVKFRELLSNPRVRIIIQEAFPDNAGLFDGLDELAISAFETSNFTKGGAKSLLKPSESVNLTGWAFLGRIGALGAANQTNLVNQLWAAGAGATLGKSLGRNITGNKIKDIVINAALDPEKGAALNLLTSNQRSGFWATAAKAAIDVINVPAAVIKRPAAAVPVLKAGEQELDDPTGEDRQSSLQPIPESVLSQVSPVGLRPMPVGQQPMPVGPRPTGPVSQETLVGLSQVGLPLFPPVRAAHGGYVNGGESRSEESGIMSIGCKPRQIVG